MEKATQTPTKPRWNPKTWTKKTQIIVGVTAAAIVIIVAVVAGAVLGTRRSTYPDYSQVTYSLQDTYSGTDFFDDFDFFNAADPANGFVHYQLQDAAIQPAHNLTYASSSSAILRVDTTSDEYDTDTGRWSVRVSSKKQYDSGLFIFDILHSPYGCATWPALWLSDDNNWPTNGEIDIIESVNQATSGNQMTLHTTDGCKMNVRRKETGDVLETNCLNSTNSNAGCGVQGPAETIGEAFNNIGGGVYATEWRDAGIRIWFFRRDSIPDDITSNSTTTSPDPSTWGSPIADFPSTNCNIGDHFRNASIIMNIDLCGDWAGSTAVYSTADSCPGTCTDFVANNSTAFEEAYWEVKSFRVYTAS